MESDYFKTGNVIVSLYRVNVARETYMFIAVFLCAVWLSVPAHGRAWEVRRLRTSDADKAGHYPAWTVRIVPAEEDAVSVEIAEEDGPARGVILVGTRFTVPPDRLAALDFRYTTSCSLEHRSGHLGAAVYTVDAWDALSSSPTTRQMEGGNGVPRPLWSWNIHSMSQPDVTEPAPVPDAVSRAMRAILRSQAGRKLVLAVTWMGAHTAVETAALHNLKIEMEELEEPMEQLLKRLDLEADGMEKVAQAIHAGDTEAAVDALIAHFHERFPKTPETSGVSRATTRDLDEALDNRFRSVGSDEYYELRTDFDWDRNAIDDKEWLLHLQWHHIIRALLQAGVVHDDPRYTAKAVELVRDWIPRNVPGSPWSWRTLEVSCRRSASIQGITSARPKAKRCLPSDSPCRSSPTPKPGAIPDGIASNTKSPHRCSKTAPRKNSRPDITSVSSTLSSLRPSRSKAQE
jgi:hypothetical protein